MKIIQGLNIVETQGNICEAENSINSTNRKNFNSSTSAMIWVGRIFVSSHKFRTGPDSLFPTDIFAFGKNGSGKIAALYILVGNPAYSCTGSPDHALPRLCLLLLCPYLSPPQRIHPLNILLFPHILPLLLNLSIVLNFAIILHTVPEPFI